MDLETELIAALEEIDDLRQINKKQTKEINKQRPQLEGREDEISKLKSEVAFLTKKIEGCIS